MPSHAPRSHTLFSSKCIHLLEWFDHRNHICLVSELLGMCVYDFLKENDFQPFPRTHIQEFAKQLLGSVACEFIHSSSVVPLWLPFSLARSQAHPHWPQTGEYSPSQQHISNGQLHAPKFRQGKFELSWNFYSSLMCCSATYEDDIKAHSRWYRYSIDWFWKCHFPRRISLKRGIN